MIGRVILIVLDSVGIGALPDAAIYGDEGSNTLGNIAKHYSSLSLPNLTSLGLGNIDPSNLLSKTETPQASYGLAAEKSAGKDTTTGHWEIAGVILDKPFPVFPNGFPRSFLQTFEEAIGRKTIGNTVASGTVIINDLGEEHVQTGKPIVYTSADSVFQVAMHEEIISVEEQYAICKTARELLQEELAVGRVIARPFIGKDGNYTRTSNRKDFSQLPPNTVLDAILAANKRVFAVGKIVDIFAGKGISGYQKTATNTEGVQQTIKAMQESKGDLIFTNLVDFDMLYGHRRNIPGYAECLMEFDSQLPTILDAMTEEDVLIITADHGNDPSFKGTDHTREYVPILATGSHVTPGKNMGNRSSFSDIAATIADALDVDFVCSGESFLPQIIKPS